MKPLLRPLAIAGATLGAFLIVAVGLFFQRFDAPGPLAGPAIVVVPKGAGVSAIANLLERQGVIASAFVFSAGARVTGSAGQLRAGEYEFPGRVSTRGVMDQLRAGRTLVRRLTVPEGLTVPQVFELVIAAYGLEGSPGPMPEEGSLLPDTYHYSYGDMREAVIARMARAMNETVTELWRGRDPAVRVTSPRDAVILASIVERETGKPEERARVAGVFYNRLARNMALQSDPTVAYGVALESGVPSRVLERPLSRADLARPSPYNTYLNRGLPPAPIANPGRAALNAVMHPAPTDAIYFVADGNGGHVFATTLEEHNRNVRRWRRLRDQKAQEDEKTAPESAPAP